MIPSLQASMRVRIYEYRVHSRSSAAWPRGIPYTEFPKESLKAAILIIPKDSRAVCLSSWAVERSSGHVAYPFLRQVIKRLERYDIYNHSAVKGVDQLMGLLGFEYVHRCSILVPGISSFLGTFSVKHEIVDKNEQIVVIHGENKVHFKCLSLTRNSRLRRLAMLLKYDGQKPEQALLIWSAWCARKGLIPIAANENLGNRRGIGLKKFGIMMRPGMLHAGGSSSLNAYDGSEFAVLDF